MQDSPTERRQADELGVRLRRAGRGSGLAAGALGAAVLLGWVLASEGMRSWLPEEFQTKPNTALVLVLAGATQWLSGRDRSERAQAAVRRLVLMLSLISGATLVEFILGRDFGFDQWLVGAPPGSVPGRMSLVATITSLLFAGALGLRTLRRPWAGRGAELTALTGLGIGFVVLLGYTFGAHTLYALGSATSIALPTALAFTLLFAGALAAYPESGLMSALVSRGAGGVLLRRLLPFAIVAPWLVGWLSVAGSNAGLYSTHVDQVTVVLPLIFLMLIFLYKSAGVLDRLDEEREQRKRDVEALNRDLEARVLDRTQELLAANEALRVAQRAAGEQVALLHLAPVAILVRDLQGRITFWSRGAEELYGWTAEEGVGRFIHDLLRTEFPEPLPAIEARAQELGIWEGEMRHTPRGGKPITVASRWAFQRDAQGDPAGFLEINMDITERKQAELELRRLNRSLRAISRCTDAVARATDEQDLLRDVCEIVVQDGGYPLAWVGYAEDDKDKTVRPAAVAGHGADYVRNARISWADTERGRGPTGTAIRSGAPCYIPEITLDPRFTPWREAALRRGYASAIAIPLLEGERSLGALNIYAPEPHAFEGEEYTLMLELAATLAHGILALRAHQERDRTATELQELNANLERRVAQRTAELAASTEEMESFTYSVSHDLRAPLRHIDGFSKVLLEECGGELNDLGRHYLERVRHGTQQMGQLIDDLLNLSRLGRCALQLRPTSLGPLVQELVDDLHPEAAGRAVEWRIGALPIADCDRRLMRQVLFNLLSNALKFTRGREPAIIEMGMQGAEIFVRDNGVGFDPQYAGKLFGVFQRLHRTEEFPGAGVGLATVRRILRKHGGDIRAESGPGAGATFYFTVGPPEAVSSPPVMEETCHVA